MSVDYLSQNFFNTCGTGYNYGCGSSYSVGNIFGGLGTSIWNMCGTYGAGTCRTKAGIRAQKRAFKQMLGQVGTMIGERAAYGVMNFLGTIVRTSITNAIESGKEDASLKERLKETKAALKEKLAAIGLSETEVKTTKAENTEICKYWKKEIDDSDKIIATSTTEIEKLKRQLQDVPEATTEPDNSGEIAQIQDANKAVQAQIDAEQKKIDDAKAAKTKAEAELEKEKEKFNTQKGEIERLIEKRNELEQKLKERKVKTDKVDDDTTIETNDNKARKNLKKLLGAINQGVSIANIEKFKTEYEQSSATVQSEYKAVYDDLNKKLEELKKNPSTAKNNFGLEAAFYG